MNNGWVKLYRKLLTSNMYKNLNSVQRDVMINCLLLANHSPNKWEWQGKIFECQPGQFITSLQKLKDICAKDVTIQNVRTALVKLEKWDFLTDQSTKTGRLITIVNWQDYQNSEIETNKPINKELTKNQQRTNKELTTNKNDKECYKNDKEINNKEKLILKNLNSVNQYPFNLKDDLDYIRELKEEFLNIDILEEVKKWKVYKRDKPLKKNSNSRLQLRNWIANASKWKKEKTGGHEATQTDDEIREMIESV